MVLTKGPFTFAEQQTIVFMSIPTMIVMPKSLLINLGIKNAENLYYQLSPEELTTLCVERGEGTLSDTGALVINTGEFTGRSPKDKFTVKDELTEEIINWNEFNQPIEAKYFDLLYQKMLDHLKNKDLFVRDCYACAAPKYRLNIRIVNEDPSSNLFAYNMFLRPLEDELENFIVDWHIIHAPSFKADSKIDGTRQHNFTIVNFKKKVILIGGSAYTGEIKKGIFSILNFILPNNDKVLSMHCSANVGSKGDTAIFFGLSGTGKTTLSADPERKLIGDDEHGWDENEVFNFEGGCYAKTIDLCEEKEPEIYHAIRAGALVENVTFKKGSTEIDFCSRKITENTRVSYPLRFITNSLEPSIGGIPKNIFFLTADAYGILPPISKLTAGQAMYHFISGYTAKIAGTETGIIDPKSTFSACFGAPFLPLHPGKYAQMLGDKIRKYQVNVWMINTGWTGGPYGTGSRIKLGYTRSMISAALSGVLSDVGYKQHSVFGIMMPLSVPGVPSELLDPRNTWADKENYDKKAAILAQQFIKNFQKYEKGVSDEILKAAPMI